MRDALYSSKAMVLAIWASTMALCMSSPAEPVPKPHSVVIGPNAFVRDRNVRIQKDAIDNFQYVRLANFDECPCHGNRIQGAAWPGRFLAHSARPSLRRRRGP